MALHLNKMALYERGFKRVASYTCFTKLGWDSSRQKYDWYVANFSCYTDGKQYLIRRVGKRGSVWDSLYDSKELANEHMKRILEDCTFRKVTKY